MEIKLTVSLDNDTKSLLTRYIAPLLENGKTGATITAPTEHRGDTFVPPATEDAPAPAKKKNAPKTAVAEPAPAPKAAEPIAEPSKVYEPEEVRAMLVEVKRNHGIAKCKELLRKYGAEGEVFAGLDPKHYEALATEISDILGG